MKKRLLLLLVATLALKVSMNIFPNIYLYSFESVLSQLLFNPFSWIGSSFLFIIGFLAVARVIKSIIESMAMKRRVASEWKSFAMLFVMFTYIALDSIVISIVVLAISLFYGIMDAKDSRMKSNISS